MTLKEQIERLAISTGADLIGFAPSARFDADDAIFKIMPEVKTVIGLGFRILRGSLRGIEEGSTFYQYSTSIETIEETIMPASALRIATLIEDEGFTALPQRRHQLIMAEENSTNPEVQHGDIMRGKKNELQMNFEDAGVKCGLGEKGLRGTLLCDRFGPLFRYCFVLTDAILDATEMYNPHLCDRCGKCIDACPGKAINKNGSIDKWQCAVYYSGACGLKNPYMPYDAYSMLEDRLDIIAGEAKVTPEKARDILNETNFYPSIRHSYSASICGRACDTECYIHLEEKGILTEKFKAPFRKRKKWQYSLCDFK